MSEPERYTDVSITGRLWCALHRF